MGWACGGDGHANLFLLLERSCELGGPRVCFFALRLFSHETRTPFALDVLAHSAQRRAEIILVALDNHLKLADVARLLGEKTVLLAFWRVGGQLGAREECRFEREDLRALGLDFAACGEKLLLELCVRELLERELGMGGRERTWYGVMSKSTLEGLAGRDSSPRFSSTVWLVRMSCYTHTPSMSIKLQDAKRRRRESPHERRGAGSSLELLPPSPSLKGAA